MRTILLLLQSISKIFMKANTRNLYFYMKGVRNLVHSIHGSYNNNNNSNTVKDTDDKFKL